MSCFNVTISRKDSPAKVNFNRVDTPLEFSFIREKPLEFTFGEICSVKECPDYILLKTSDGQLIMAKDKSLLAVLKLR